MYDCGMKAYDVLEIWLHSFVNVALYMYEWLALRFGFFTLLDHRAPNVMATVGLDAGQSRNVGGTVGSRTK
jgi:hypothetical protein